MTQATAGATGSTLKQQNDHDTNQHSDGSNSAAHAVQGAADRISAAGERIGAQVEHVANRAAGAVGSTVDYVRNKDSQELMDDVRELTVRHPAATLATALVAGVLLGRSLSRS